MDPGLIIALVVSVVDVHVKLIGFPTTTDAGAESVQDGVEGAAGQDMHASQPPGQAPHPGGTHIYVS